MQSWLELWWRSDSRSQLVPSVQLLTLIWCQSVLVLRWTEIHSAENLASKVVFLPHVKWKWDLLELTMKFQKRRQHTDVVELLVSLLSRPSFCFFSRQSSGMRVGTEIPVRHTSEITISFPPCTVLIKLHYLREKSTSTDCLATPSGCIHHSLLACTTHMCLSDMNYHSCLFCPQTAELPKCLKQKMQ